MVTVCDTDHTVDVLGRALIEAVQSLAEARERAPAPANLTAWTWAAATPIKGCSLRDAFFSPSRSVPFEDSLGHIAAETVCPYPPGVPVLMPGERITVGTLDALEAARASGTRLAYASDPTCATLRVLK